MRDYSYIPEPPIDALAELRNVAVDKTLPREERIVEYVRQIKDPYRFRHGKFIVNTGYTPGGGTLEDCLMAILR